MIVQESFTKNGVNFVRTYSDANMQIEQVETGVLYDEAVDIAGAYTYTESSTPIEIEETDEYAEAGRILMGVSE